jgi:hypothetical protein
MEKILSNKKVGFYRGITLTLALFPFFFLHMYDYVVIDSGYHEAFSYFGRFDPGDA